MSEMTDKDRETKKELIESIQSILNANKDNDYCCNIGYRTWLSSNLNYMKYMIEIIIIAEIIMISWYLINQ